MNQLISKEKINLYLNYFILFYSGTFLINSGLTRIVLAISFLLWIVEGNFKNKIKEIFKQKFFLAYFGMILMFFISLILFSDNVTYGWWNNKYETGFEYLLNKPIKYSIMMLIIFTSLQKRFLKYILIVFVLQVVYISAYTDGIILNLIEGTKHYPYPIVKHIYLSIIINIAIFTSIYLYFKEDRIYLKFIYILVTVFLIINLFIMESRTGQVSFLVISSLILFFLYKNSFLKKLVFLILLVSISIGMIFTFYNLSSKFKQRVDVGVKDVKMMVEKKEFHTSLGVRVMFNTVNTSLLFENTSNFIFGTGMGDAKQKFEKYLDEKFPEHKYLLKYEHVHNQYLQNWVDGGLFALILFVLMFYYLFKLKVSKYEKIFLISILSIFILYGFSGIYFARVKMIELFTLFSVIFILSEKYKRIINNKSHN